MKKLLSVVGLIAVITLSSCSFEGYNHCPTYSTHNKMTKHGQKAQSKYIKRKI